MQKPTIAPYGSWHSPLSAELIAAGAKPLAAPQVTLATAHPAKFPETVRQAIGISPPLPKKCADLLSRPETAVGLPNDPAKVKALISERSRAWA